MRRALLLAVALVAIATPAARADRVSRNQEAFSGDQSQLCRWALGTDTEVCNRDGRDVSEARIAEYEQSDLHRRIALQRRLDDGAPLRDALFPHTHNSFNSEAYTPTLSRLDNNQILSLTDQLRLDMRAVEIDIHRAPSARDGRVGVVACHATQVGPVHAGCTTEEPLLTYLTELEGWLDANPGELVILYLENQLEGDLAAHEEAARNIEDTIGEHVYRTSSPCEPMPYGKSRAQLRPARVLIVGNCGPGAWGGLVHDRGPLWDESSNPAGEDYDCAEREPDAYDTKITRRYEDRTWLSAMAGSEGGITVAEMADMVTCGVNLVGFDLLYPDDPRLETLVWSWAPSEPSAPGCAVQRGDSRWAVAGCEELRPAACSDGNGGPWSLSAPVRYADAGAACAFSAPRNGWENHLLRTAADAAGAGSVWVRWSSDTEVAPE